MISIPAEGAFLNTFDRRNPSARTGSRIDNFIEWYSLAAYAHLQRTRPQTAAYSLNDSPAGLAAWILEKFHDWSDSDGDLFQSLNQDELLTNVTLYWITQTISSSFRMYYENRKAPLQFGPGDFVRPHCGLHFSRRKYRPICEECRALVDKYKEAVDQYAGSATFLRRLLGNLCLAIFTKQAVCFFRTVLLCCANFMRIRSTRILNPVRWKIAEARISSDPYADRIFFDQPCSYCSESIGTAGLLPQ